VEGVVGEVEVVVGDGFGFTGAATTKEVLGEVVDAGPEPSVVEAG
jgi:hypothetical protein